MCLPTAPTFLQIREKALERDAFQRKPSACRAQAARYHVPFVVNDSIEVALECGADGVHMGQTDLAGKPVRSLIGPDKILGISANTVDAAVAAEQAGADYIGAGAVFSTTTKADAGSLTLARLRAICDAVTIPVVAIGGINADNLPALKGSGVDGVAVVSASSPSATRGLRPPVCGRWPRQLVDAMDKRFCIFDMDGTLVDSMRHWKKPGP
ncbi:MAG: thiamine phosphate synthase [Oscillospiraceae bacterium]